MANSNGNGNGAAVAKVAPPQLNSASLGYVEELYEAFLKGRDAVPPEWATYFDAMHSSPDGNGNGSAHATWTPEPPFAPRSIFNPPGEAPATSKTSPGQQRMDVAAHQEKVDTLIRNYRVRGHIAASLDPLGQPKSAPPELDPAFYGFTDEDMDRELSTVAVGGPDVRTLRQLVNWLKTTYSRNIGVQYMHIDSLRVREWLQEEMEKTGNRLRLKHEEQVRILKRLADAVVFEEFLAKKFVGKKSFSLEGGETLIPLLDLAIEKSGNEGVREVVIGMAHRGRLNVLANILHKSPRMIFREFDDKDPLRFGHGDVKYHLGHSSDFFTSQGKKVHLSLCFNPSHLEYVNTVAQGRIRAKQDRFRDFRREHGCCILIHGDAAFAGEGVVQETLNLAELKGYKIGGTIHIILNNQVGFTTPPDEARSTTYSSDVAKMLQSPIFHVNGEDPEAVAQVVSLALDFRRKFRRDVVIDMYCYRRRGHNEGDEPEYTQPVMYKAIKQRPHMFESYLQHLLGQRGVTREEAEKIGEERRAKLDAELTEARSDKFMRTVDHWGGIWSGFVGGPASQADDPLTAVPVDKLSKILHAQTIVPEDFTPHPKIQKLLLEVRKEMAEGKKPLDWGSAEALAFGTLLTEGRPIRITGQDVRRGTFSHRHAVLYDYNDGHTFKPLKNIEPERGRVEIYNSPLSEAGVLGFEYGYSLDCPEGLIIWEAQFGDFANAGQVIIDQFITSAEDKWDRLSQLVMMLPHGYEGQGPEHSSARLERFLQMCADDNIQVTQPSTPAQLFHLLRRQTLRKWKKPLVIMTPKSLFRLPACTSTLEECATGKFEPILLDKQPVDPEKVNRILMCSGRVYYDLVKKRETEKRDDIVIHRMEELYPLHKNTLHNALAPYPEGTPVVWVQDEPENMGAWRFLRITYGERLFNKHPFSCVSRPTSASPATGSHSAHEREQAKLLADAFAG